MAELVTLDSLFPGGPAAADDPAEGTETPGANANHAPSAPAGTDLAAKIADLEQRNTRYLQQIEGNRADARRQQQEVARLQGQIAGIESRLNAPAAQTPATPQRKVSLVEAHRKALLDNDETALAEWEAQHQQPTPTGVTREEIAKIVADAERERDAKQHAIASTLTLQQALVARHPELLDMTRHSAFLAQAGARYAELRNDPVTHLLYPETPGAIFTDPGSGETYDMRVLLQAMNEVKAKQPPAPSAPPPTLGVTQTAPGPSGPRVPSHLVQLLQNPDIQRHLANVPGWEGSTKEQVTKILKHTDPAVKARWQRGEVA